MNKTSRRTVLLGVAAAPLAGFAAQAPARSATIDLRILHTSDMHNNLADWDALVDQPRAHGLTKLASVIRTARAERSNCLLLDCGDTIQGDPMGSMLAARGLRPGETHPMFRAMQQIGYDAAAIGNHEFDFGLDHLRRSIDGVHFPLLLANLMPINSAPIGRPSVMLTREMQTSKGTPTTLRIGVIGVCTSTVLVWNGVHLRGKMASESMVSAVRRIVPRLRAAGADLVVVLAHSGLTLPGSQPPVGDVDSGQGRNLSRIAGVDVLLLGHWHQRFPGSAWAGDPTIDLRRSQLNGVPTSSVGSEAKGVGVLDLRLGKPNGRWQVIESTQQFRSTESASIAADPTVSEIAAPYLAETRQFLGARHGTLPIRVDTFLSAIALDPAMQIVHAAMAWAGRRFLAARHPDLNELPLITASPVFRDGHIGGPGFVDLPVGAFQLRSAYQLYPFDNYPQFLKLTVGALRAWMERCAAIYETVPVGGGDGAMLLADDANLGMVDSFGGCNYRIDLSRPGQNAPIEAGRTETGSRIRDLSIDGHSAKDDAMIVVMVGHYRAYGGGGFPGIDSSRIVASMADSRDVIPQIIAAFMDDGGAQRLPALWPGDGWRLTVPAPASFRSNAIAAERYANDPRLRFSQTSDGRTKATLLPDS